MHDSCGELVQVSKLMSSFDDYGLAKLAFVGLGWGNKARANKYIKKCNGS